MENNLYDWLSMLERTKILPKFSPEFFHTHPDMEKSMGMDNSHVIIDKEAYEIIFQFLQFIPESKLLNPITPTNPKKWVFKADHFQYIGNAVEWLNQNQDNIIISITDAGRFRDEGVIIFYKIPLT